ncbi:metallophosphoesterase family protein [Stieleria varia]|uniref:Calcineurin-like phosphoesterase superfamily domain protein n=1 Tax=Stieleria varia TaxID=2528005 RepID=A0A5C6B1T5_9BACT|nr:metallophosphoesterase family protein [Stieleria varia]TWU04354.1 Calcineurin-like phosphoesterase superfamily domain protein [Stieleria varia]
MKLLCFSDLHRDVDAAKRLVELATEVDVVIGAGDFANQHQGLHDTLDVLQAIRCPAILVPGNGETVEELKAATVDWESATVLHGSGCSVMGVEFWGVGGGIPVTPFGPWSYDFDENQAAEMLSGCPPRCVLVVHSPPLDTVDHDSSGRVRGSRAIRETVKQKQPRWVVCGHIHSDWENQVRLGQTRVLNAGPRGVVIKLE